MTTDLTKLVIDRRKWRRGTSGALLLDRSGRMCCLGFRAIQCGYAQDQIKSIGTPYGVADSHGLLPGFGDMVDLGLHKNSELATKAMFINDRPAIDDANREAQLAGLFAEHGIAITFEN